MSPAENNQNSLVEPSRPPGKVDNPHDCLDKLFVWRKELQDLIDFATTETVSRRLRTVAGPPGYGKTCLLHKLHQTLNDKSVKKFKKLFVIWTPIGQFNEFNDLETWLKAIVEQAKDECAQLSKFDSTSESKNVISQLLEKLCETCRPKRRIILIVDALDELPDLRQELEDHFLAHFWRKECVRIIISFRDEFSLKNPNLRRSERRITLTTFSQEQGQEQLDKRAKLIPEPLSSPFKHLLELVHPYKFNHPGLNTLLSQTINKNEHNSQNPVLTAADLRQCWLALIKEPLAAEPGYAAVLERDLKTIVLHPEDSWTFETFADICKYSQNEAFAHWQDLMAACVVEQHPDYSQRYRVIDGLRELLCAELRLREEEK